MFTLQKWGAKTAYFVTVLISTKLCQMTKTRQEFLPTFSKRPPWSRCSGIRWHRIVNGNGTNKIQSLVSRGPKSFQFAVASRWATLSGDTSLIVTFSSSSYFPACFSGNSGVYKQCKTNAIIVKTWQTARPPVVRCHVFKMEQQATTMSTTTTNNVLMASACTTPTEKILTSARSSGVIWPATDSTTTTSRPVCPVSNFISPVSYTHLTLPTNREV